PDDLIARDEFLARKNDLIARIQAAEAVPRPVLLIHRGVHSAEGFSWGDRSSGAADLAQSMLTVEAGDEVAASRYLRFRDEIVARLPASEGFRLPAREVWRWMEANRELIEREGFEEPSHAVVDQPVDAAVEVEPIDRTATASAVVAACEAAW